MATETEFKIPSTPEEFQKYMDKVKEEAYKNGANDATEQSQSLISQLESKIALVENNPLLFPRLETKDGIKELQKIHPFSISDGEKTIMYTHDILTNDDAAMKQMNMEASEVLLELYRIAPDIFTKI